jgi:cysteine sulfinate desulfinase/cysteine desulfurase-like protein
MRRAPGEPSAPRRARLGAQGLLTYTLVPVSAEGVASAAAVRGALRPGETAVVSLMHANNETGALQPVAEAAAAARAAGALVHCDAAQSVGKARARALTCRRVSAVLRTPYPTLVTLSYLVAGQHGTGGCPAAS